MPFEALAGGQGMAGAFHPWETIVGNAGPLAGYAKLCDWGARTRDLGSSVCD